MARQREVKLYIDHADEMLRVAKHNPEQAGANVEDALQFVTRVKQYLQQEGWL